MDLKIFSSIQFNPRLARCRADTMDNFRRLEPLVRQAGAMGTSFLVFPELCLTGYSFMSKDEAGEVAELSDGPTYQKMRTIAQALSCFVSYGYIEVDPVDGSLYNSAAMISPLGKIIASCRKVNLWGNDYLWARSGTSAAPVVTTPFGETSLVICRDIRNKIPTNIPRHGHISAKCDRLFDGQKIDLVAACTNWGNGGGFPSTSWMDFAADNRCTLVVANRWGVESNGTFSQDFGHGGSIIIERDWKVHTNGLKFNADCVVTSAF